MGVQNWEEQSQCVCEALGCKSMAPAKLQDSSSFLASMAQSKSLHKTAVQAIAHFLPWSPLQPKTSQTTKGGWLLIPIHVLLCATFHMNLFFLTCFLLVVVHLFVCFLAYTFAILSMTFESHVSFHLLKPMSPLEFLILVVVILLLLSGCLAYL